MTDVIEYMPYIAAGLAASLFFGAIYVVTDRGPKSQVALTAPSTHVVITGGSSGILSGLQQLICYEM